MKLWKKFLIVVLFLVGIHTYIFFRSSDVLFLDTSNPLTIEEVLKLSQNSKDITNIHMMRKNKTSFKDKWEMWFPNERERESLDSGAQIGYGLGESETLVKDNKILTISSTKSRNGNSGLYNNKQYSWMDLDAKEEISIFFNDGSVFHKKNSEIIFSWRAHFFDTEYNEKNDEYMYLGRAKMNGRDTVVIKIYNAAAQTSRIYYIDEETGIIVKEKYKKSSETFMYTTRYTMKFEIDVVTDEDVKKSIIKPNIRILKLL